MKKVISIIIVLLLTTLSTQSIAVLKQNKPATPDQVVKQIITHFMKKNHVPGVAVAIYIHNRPYTYYFGYANKASKKPVNNQTVFELGSITKLFTALLLAQQIDAGKMQLDAPITQYIPALKQAKGGITQVSLLNLATYTASFPWDLPPDINSKNNLMNYLANWNSNAAVNKQWAYSNIGMGLLGYAIADSTNQSYENLLKQKILQVLGMQHTYLTLANNTNLAQGYNDDGKPAAYLQAGLLPAAGALKSTLPDMQRFLSAAIHISGTPYSILHALHIAQTPYFELANKMQQGLGWQIYPLNNQNAKAIIDSSGKFNLQTSQAAQILKQRKFNSNALLDKTGATDGFRTYIAAIPSTGSGIVILANRYVANGPIVKAGRTILFKLNAMHNE